MQRRDFDSQKDGSRGPPPPAQAGEVRGRAGAARSRRAGAKLKAEERLAAARAEHARHRADQVSRHEIVVHPHVDALLLVAEPAWRTTVEVVRGQERQSAAALYIPRTRRWELLGSAA